MIEPTPFPSRPVMVVHPLFDYREVPLYLVFYPKRFGAVRCGAVRFGSRLSVPYVMGPAKLIPTRRSVGVDLSLAVAFMLVSVAVRRVFLRICRMGSFGRSEG